jgi:hypothetical protein
MLESACLETGKDKIGRAVLAKIAKSLQVAGLQERGERWWYPCIAVDRILYVQIGEVVDVCGRASDVRNEAFKLRLYKSADDETGEALALKPICSIVVVCDPG